MALWHNQQLMRNTFYILLLIAAAVFLYLIRGLFITILLSVVLVYLIHPLVKAMEAHGASRVPAIFIAYLGVLIVAAAFLMYGIPRLIAQLHMLVEMLPYYTAQVEDVVRSIQTTYYKTELPEAMRQEIDRQIYNFEAVLQSWLGQAVEVLLSLVGCTFDVILAPVLSFYILKDLEQIKAKAEKWAPRHYFPDLWALAYEINEVLNSFIRGHLILVLAVGLMTGIAMALLGVQYAAMLGIVSGAAELIPYFGPLIGSIPAVIIALLHSKWMAVKVILAIVLIQQLEGSIIAPKILGESVGLHPLAIILVLLVGAELYGILGMLLAVPAAAIIRILVVFIYERLTPGYNNS